MIGFFYLTEYLGGGGEKVLAQRIFLNNCCLKKCFQILCVLAYPNIWQWIACLSRNIKVEGFENLSTLNIKNLYFSKGVYVL